MRPIIGVTCDFELPQHGARRARTYVNAAYLDAVFAAGGLPQPVPIPPTTNEALLDELLARYAGLLFTGGPDLNPAQYGQEAHPHTRVLHQRRDRFEVEFFRRADRADTPILALCLGCQVANVARGGCLVQHVDDLPRDSAVEHYKSDHSNAYHPVRIEPDSHLARIVGRTDLEVNSRHHQIVDRQRMGGGLRPVAFAPDGVVEAAEDSHGRFLLAVQWHPEDLIDRTEHLRLFEALVDRAAQRILTE